MKTLLYVTILLVISFTGIALSDVTVSYQPLRGQGTPFFDRLDNVLKIDTSITRHTADSTTEEIKVTNNTGAWYYASAYTTTAELVQGSVKPLLLGPHWSAKIGTVTFYKGGKLYISANTNSPAIAAGIAVDMAYRIEFDRKGLPQQWNTSDQLISLAGKIPSDKTQAVVSAISALKEKKSADAAWNLAQALYQVLEIKPVEAVFTQNFHHSLPELSKINLLISGASMAELWAFQSKAFFSEEVVQFSGVDKFQSTSDTTINTTTNAPSPQYVAQSNTSNQQPSTQSVSATQLLSQGALQPVMGVKVNAVEYDNAYKPDTNTVYQLDHKWDWFEAEVAIPDVNKQFENADDLIGLFPQFERAFQSRQIRQFKNPVQIRVHVVGEMQLQLMNSGNLVLINPRFIQAPVDANATSINAEELLSHSALQPVPDVKVNGVAYNDTYLMDSNTVFNIDRKWGLVRSRCGNP